MNTHTVFDYILIMKTQKSKIRHFIQEHKMFFQSKTLDIDTKAGCCTRHWHFFRQGLNYDHVNYAGPNAYYIWMPFELSDVKPADAKDILKDYTDALDIINPCKPRDAWSDGWSWYELTDERMEILHIMIEHAIKVRNDTCEEIIKKLSEEK